MSADFEIIDVSLEPHPNADTLSIQKLGDQTCVVKTEQWKSFSKAVYIAPDALVNTALPEFTFLSSKARSDGWYRIRACNLRGVKSFGLMVPLTRPVEELDIRHWNPPEPTESVTTKSGKKVIFDPDPVKGPPFSKYDLDNGRRYARERFEVGEEVVVTEKIHGANARYLFQDGEQFCGSRNGWKRRKSSMTVEQIAAKIIEQGVEAEEATVIAERLFTAGTRDKWWQAFEFDPPIEAFCRKYPGYTLVGEIYGQSISGADFAYDASSYIAFRYFDVMTWEGQFLNYEQRSALDFCGVRPAPELYRGPFDPQLIADLAEGRSTLNPATLREGVVVESVKTGQKLKWVGVGYLDRKKD